MASKRVARVNEQMKRELIGLLRFDVRDPRVGTVTVTDVETAPDLYHAKVFVNIPGDGDERVRAMEGLRAAAGFLRGEIGRRMHIRHAPELHFKIDETLQHAMHIEQLLREARASTSAYDDEDELEIEVELEDDDDMDDDDFDDDDFDDDDIDDDDIDDDDMDDDDMDEDEDDTDEDDTRRDD